MRTAMAVLALTVASANADATILDDPIATATGWTLAGGAAHLAASAQCDGGAGGCLSIPSQGTASKSPSTTGFANVRVSVRLAATGLGASEQCTATVTAGGSFTRVTLTVVDGADDGTFAKAAVSVPIEHSSFTITFENNATGAGLCFGDTLLVTGDQIVSAGPLALPATGAGQVTRLQRDCGQTEESGTARSFDGNDWAPIPPHPLPVNCVAGACSVTIPSDGLIYCLHEVDTQHVPTSAEAAAARLLQQATFGPSDAEINHVSSTLAGDVSAFLTEQFAAPATTLRGHYRERTSAIQAPDDGYGVLRSACEPGSRWTAFAFHFSDVTQTVTATLDELSTGFYTLRIDSVLITEVPAAGWTLGGGSFYICDVDDWRGFNGNGLWLSATIGVCQYNAMLLVPNVPVHFEAPNANTLDFSAVGLTQHSVRGADVVFVSGPAPACIGNFFSSETFMCTATSCYRHDPRIKTLENSVASPALNGNSAESCPAVVKTFLNEDSCVKSAECTQLTSGSASFILDDDVLRAWYTESNVYAYRVRNLTLESPYDVSPCVSGTSRWRRTNGTCENPTGGIDAATLITLQTALSTSTDTNLYVRDITLNGGATCVDTASETVGAQIQIGDECFEHVHPHEDDVRDFSLWAIIHDGNPVAEANGRPNPITKWVNTTEMAIYFPSNHPITRWTEKNRFMPLAGRFGDIVDFSSLLSEFQTPEIAELVGAFPAAGAEAFETCGSPAEAGNVPSQGNYFPILGISGQAALNSLDYPMRYSAAKSAVWTDVVFTADDQLRQRVAWILSQILVVGDSIGGDQAIELWVIYYDIFVRHAFGSYRNIMKEVAYNPIMGEYLTYRGSRSYAADFNFPDENFAREIMQLFSIGLFRLGPDGQRVLDGFGNPIDTYTNDDIVAFARIWTGFDRQALRPNIERENGAFSQNFIDPMRVVADSRDRLPKTALDSGYIGDGFPVCEDLPSQDYLREGAVYELTGGSSVEGDLVDGMESLPTEIFQAEAGTFSAPPPGFEANIGSMDFSGTGQEEFVEWSVNRAGPESVTLFAYYYLPVSTLETRTMTVSVNGLPAGDMTFSGTGGVRLGSSSGVTINLIAGVNTIRLTDPIGSDGAYLDFVGFGGNGAIRARLEPSVASPLYQTLCAAAGGTCTFPSKVTLTANLACHDTTECNAGRVNVVAITDPSTNLRQYYTHRPRPCVHRSIHGGGRVTQSYWRQQCTSEDAVAGVSCCVPGTTDRLLPDILSGDCLFANEAVSYAVASARCTARGGAVCEVGNFVGAFFHNTCAEDMFTWSTQTCTMRVQVYPDSKIGLVDPSINDVSRFPFRGYVESSRNTFRVRWGGAVPTAPTCGTGCSVVNTLEGDTCLCDAAVSETVPFTNPLTPPTANTVETTLFEGSLSPAAHGAGTYVACGACPSGMTVWTLATDGGSWTRSTIFELPPRVAGGAPRYLYNRVSTVFVGDTSFRNPPSFMPGIGELTMTTYRDYLSAALLNPVAEHEVDALIDHLFTHQNTGPFVATRLIQQMVTSNPSPGYVADVVTAFTTGTHAGFGSGNYGDLMATTAAVLLHAEARSPTLDADPTHGHAFEPLLKVISILRGLEWTASFGQPLVVFNSEGSMGMEAFNSPTVFGFYRPEFAAAGPVSNAQLVSPELQLAQTPFVVGYLNGMVSLIDNGLCSCADGFGGFTNFYSNDAAIGHQGFLTWSPGTNDPATVVNRLAMVLTQDRLHPDLRVRIAEAYAAEAAASNHDAALRLAEKLVLMSPEAQVSSLNSLTDVPQPGSTATESGGRPFKAVVVLFMSGGCDSFNVLVPHSNCINGDGSGSDAPPGSYAEYAQVRTNGAIPQGQLLPINTPPGNTQPCGTYGINNNLPVYQQLYNSNQGAFIANIGAMIEPVDRADYNGSSGLNKAFPPSLFAHNAQQVALATVHAENVNAKGVLARTVQALLDDPTPYKSELFSIAGNQRLLQGGDQGYDIVDRFSGIDQFNQYNDLIDEFNAISESESDSIFTDTFSKLMRASLAKTNAVGSQLDAVATDTPFGNDIVSQQLRQVSRLIKLRDSLELERAVFVVERGAFDTHNTWNIDSQLADVNAGLASFVAEMESQGVWDDVVFVTVSDFARTLTSNGQGSDHAWGGHQFIAGGSVNGGRILGDYPGTLAANGELNIGRGRLIPTLPWEYMWSGIVEWFGVSPAAMADVLPHRANFPSSQLADSTSDVDLFNGTGTGPSGPTTHTVNWEIPPQPATSLPTVNAAMGDTVQFSWTGFHDVNLVNAASCDFTGSTELSPDAVGGTYDFVPTTPGTYHFACAVGPHCSLGMLVTVNVVGTASPTQSPTASPTLSPTTSAPTESPTTSSPTESPTESPSTSSPTTSPTTSSPTGSPTSSPTTSSPTGSPTTSSPTSSPTVSPTTSSPTTSPTTSSPTGSPSTSPTTSSPTGSPTTSSPTGSPTVSPTTSSPTTSPTTSSPTGSPTSSPTTSSPTGSPTTSSPTSSPTGSPTASSPTTSPTTSSPTESPNTSPTTSAPSTSPTGSPTTSNPTQSPTNSPATSTPSASPSMSPTTSSPSSSPTASPTTASPTTSPTMSPTTSTPTISPTVSPSTSSPTASPTTSSPTSTPTSSPSMTAPTLSPTTTSPTTSPSDSPTSSPTTSNPTASPTTTSPTSSPTHSPSTSSPTSSPSTSTPSASPTAAPSTSTPTASPVTASPTNSPTGSPVTAAPTVSPTTSPTTSSPTESPSTSAPTSLSPSMSPTASPTTSSPTTSPTTSAPTTSPSVSPTTPTPTTSPSGSPTTASPTGSPTASPTTSTPTSSPTTSPTTTSPTDSPTTSSPTAPTTAPSETNMGMGMGMGMGGMGGPPVTSAPVTSAPTNGGMGMGMAMGSMGGMGGMGKRREPAPSTQIESPSASYLPVMLIGSVMLLTVVGVALRRRYRSLPADAADEMEWDDEKVTAYPTCEQHSSAATDVVVVP